MKERIDFKSYNPTVLVVFGATGDLMSRKLVPAIFRLHQKKLLPPLFSVVGFSRQEMSDGEFRSRIKENLLKIGASAESADSFLKPFFYARGFFEKSAGYKNLAKLLGYRDNEWKTCANKLFYLAVPPEYYRPIFKNLSSSGLTEPCSPEEGWTRVIVEKPFGKNLKTAEELDDLLGKLFKEEQIYRIDHYLGKETVQNIIAFRFSNSFLEPAWDKNSIDGVDIRLWEKGGVGERGSFYDGVGALRDVGQNHLLQLLSLFAMENPVSFDAASVRKKRFEVLDKLRVFSPDETEKFTVRAQYEGYRKEKGVKPDSNTETWFRLTAFLETPRWKDVPFRLESGKMMSESKVEVMVTFKHPSPCLCPPSAGKHYRNILRYNIQPKEGISTSFWVKSPGVEMELEEKDFSFDYKAAFSEKVFADAYERLLLDAVSGNQTLFVSTDEIRASWKFIDPILKSWKRGKPPLVFYKSGSEPESGKPETARPGMKKEIGIIGLGKMGKNLSLRLLEKEWKVAAYDVNEKAADEIRTKGGTAAENIKGLVKKLKSPRVVWLMLPAGKIVDETIFGKNGLSEILGKGDVLIDGGNSFYGDSLKRAKKLKKLGIHFLDVGVSGGPGGARSGACLMIGGEKQVYEEVENLFEDLAVAGGYVYAGKSGAGHFVKMVHNGIEYGMMQALAEGFAVLEKSGFKPDLQKIAGLYNHGSVIESRLVGWLEKAFQEYGEGLEGVSGSVAHTGEGEWTVRTAKKLGVDVGIIEKSFEFRVKSAGKPSFTGKILSALRNQFGGHDVKSKN